MHRSLLLSLSIGIAATPTTYAQNTRGASNYESVSAEPLTFTVPIEEEQPDRRERILAEADIASGHEFEWMEDYEVMEGLDLVEGEDAENDGDVNAGYRDFGNEDFVDEGFDMDSEEPDEEEDEYFDSTYGTEDGEDFFAQEEEVRGDAIGGEELEDLSDVDAGYDEVGTPLEANEPIARKLRRITEPKVKVTFEDEERYLAEKESMRDDSIPIVSALTMYFDDQPITTRIMKLIPSLYKSISLFQTHSSCQLKMRMRKSISLPSIRLNTSKNSTVKTKANVTSNLAADGTNVVPR